MARIISSVSNKLKLNDDKTAAMIVSSGRKYRPLSFFLPRLYNRRLYICSLVGLCHAPWCYTWLPFDHENPCLQARSATFELRRISSIRHLLSTDATKTLVSAFVLSRLDYGNSLFVLFFGCPQYLLSKLQKIQNDAAHPVLRVSNTDHISSHLASTGLKTPTN